jgi:spermidine synthase
MTFLLCLIFFVSGAAALLFETLWFRQAGLALGNSIWASSLVLAAFMGGLALGNGLVGRRGHGWRRPMRIYALLELAIATTGVAVVHALPLLTPYVSPLFGPLLDAPWLLNPLRLAIAFPLLLVPSTAMGMTLPLLASALYRRDADFGRVLGRLYGWNTLGAVVGALAGDLLLVGLFGVRGTALAAAALNVLAAAAALTLARPLDVEATAAPLPEPRRLPPRALALLAAAFLLGGTLLALEVVWFRFLLLFVHASSLAFAVMLAVVLAGIGSGSLLASRGLGTRAELWRFLPAVALASGVLCPTTYVLFGFVPAIALGGALSWLVTLQLGIVLMFPVSLLSGALFTLLGVALLRESHGVTRTAGLLTLCNTTGAMLGSLVGGLVLLPTLGMERSILVLAASYGVAAALLVLGGLGPVSARQSTAVYVCGGGLLLALLLFPSGLAERRYLRAPLLWFIDNEQAVVVETREGLNETSTYLRRDRFGEPVYYRLMTNSHSMSGTMSSAERYMKLFVYLPVALHPDPRSALLISYGVGSTAKALTDTSSLETIDVVDTSRDVLDMNRIVYPEPGSLPLEDPRVRVHIEDGRFFLQTTPQRFDIITGEPPPPKHAGIVNLYTREYFALVHDRLTEGGIATYWLPVHALTESDAKAILRAFCDVFEDCTLWDGSPLNWIMMGTRDARGPVSSERFTQQWRDPVVAPELEALGVERPEQLGALFLAGADDLRGITAGTPALDDDHPRRLSEVPTVATAMVDVYRPWMESQRARERFERSELVRKLWPPSLREDSLAWFPWQRTLNRSLFAELGEPARELPELHRILTATSLRTAPLWYLGTDADELAAARTAWKKGRRSAPLLYQLGAAALAERDWPAAAEYFRQAQQGAANRELVYYQVYALGMAGRQDEARRVAVQAGVPRPGVAGDQAFVRFASEALGLDIPAG